MRQVAHLHFGPSHAMLKHGFLPGHTEETKIQLVASIVYSDHATNDQIFSTEYSPIAKIHILSCGGKRQHICTWNGGEKTATLQIPLNNTPNILINRYTI